MTSAASNHLRRVWKSVPLSRLTQGSTLSIHSKMHRPLQVQIFPAWRDDGHAEFSQIIHDPDEWPMTMQVTQENDQINSLGRIEPHTRIEVKPAVVGSSSIQTGSKNELEGLVGFATDDAFPKEDDTTKGHCSTDSHDGIAHQQQSSKNEMSAIQIKVQIPEKSNLQCFLLQGGGNITIQSKLEGDVSCQTSDGNIVVKKIRGHVIHLSAANTHNLVYVSSLLEGQNIQVTSRGRFRAKQIHGSNIQITVSAQDDEDHPENKGSPSSGSCATDDDVDDEQSLVDISSLFVSSGSGEATIDVQGNDTALDRRAVRIKSSHGPVQVNASRLSQPNHINAFTSQAYPLVELGGVNGSCEVCIDLSNTKSGKDDDNEENIVDDGSDDSDWTSCMVHVDSLAQDTVSLVTADQGRISLTFDRKVEADLRLVSVSDVDYVIPAGSIIADGNDDTTTVVEELRQSLQDTGPSSDSSTQRISIHTQAFTPNDGATFTDAYWDYVEGWIENKSAEPDSRFDQKQRGHASVGKIRLEAASEQALQGFSGETKKQRDQSGSEYLRPLFAAAGTNMITVETVSWLGAIARRYGLDETKRDAGRTASRTGRELKPRE